ncbi:MAG: response regulator [Patescibacteria group bacterium]|nr:response regulator [Patescibacteria group bacterium]
MKKILIIEDESILQKALKNILEEQPYKVINALNGETGLNMAIAQIPDLIILDLILPKKEGFEVLEELKKNIETKKIPVVILTNIERIEDMEKAFELGAAAYLIKTQYKLEELLKKVNEMLKQ